MHPLLKPRVALTLLLALTALLVFRGVLPALSKVDTDFPNYFTAAKIVSDHGDVDRLYDDAWFQEQMHRYGTGSLGKFSPFPPPTALLFVPIAHLDELTALRVITMLNAFFLIAAVILLSRVLAWPLTDTAVFVLLAGTAVLNNLKYGQIYIFVSCAMILGYYLYLRSKPLIAGACFGLFTPIKYYPIVLLAHFSATRKWQVVLGGVTAIAGVVALGIFTLGWKLHDEFIGSILGHHLVANMQNPFAASFQSFDSLLRRLFVFDPEHNPHPLWAIPALQVIGLLVIKISILVMTLATLVKSAKENASLPDDVSVGLLGVATLLLAPATATYHMVLLWLPIGLLVNRCRQEGQMNYAYSILACYALIGFFPYGWTDPLAERGLLVVFAYPRLLLLATILALCIRSVWTLGNADRRGANSDPVLHG
jgi:hypothetical protein